MIDPEQLQQGQRITFRIEVSETTATYEGEGWVLRHDEWDGAPVIRVLDFGPNPRDHGQVGIVYHDEVTGLA